MEKDSTANDRKDTETGELDPMDKTVFEHVNLGVWDLYVMRTRLSRYLPTSWKVEEYVGIWKDIPYLWRTLRDMDTVARPLLLLYLGITIAKSLTPAVQSAIDNRTVDARLLFRVAGGRALCTVVEHALGCFPKGPSYSVFLREQGDGSLLIPVSLASEAVSHFAIRSGFILSPGNTWAAITRNNDYIRMEGLNRVVKDTKHRKELVAGGLAEFLTEEYRSLADRLGGRANDFFAAYFSYVRTPTLEPISLLRVPLKELPQIIFTLQAVKKPIITIIFEKMGSISDRLSSLRKLYEAENIPNKVVDGTIPFPENAQSISDGISLEFRCTLGVASGIHRNVSFRYPGSEQYALRDVSFKVLPGQLCVIVGSNGSGKSTILKLSARIFDPIEGSILINGLDIKTLKLADLRRAMAILFQDYTLFPLSIRDNIGLGNPRLAGDDAAIEEAARLGGASELIARLPDGFDTYLERPVHDQYMGLPEGTRKLFGRKVVDRPLRSTDNTSDHELSGGQRQRLAVARTFMRSSTMEQEVGLLMFDEPSASLDPTAEHDLFSRLRKLRGNKTMIFSTHRFGNLTRHADIILYMNDSAIVEAGTHEELLGHEDSDYGRLWRMQAEAFL
ncbi:P-loop containing nucleoside triphosphate hydrolase protein [Lactarius hatsudake]|nr:P-loop containing nucleoside triphosphate hydrolase protein [Lactarius hatsudake]